jgi:hypothetical protein
MIDRDTIKKIEEHIYTKPRTIQEIAELIKKSWRTADSYVDTIASETGNIAIRTLRGGTRGAVKIVYWNNIEKIHSSQAQERLFKQIELGRIKHDFSPFNIYQYVDEKKRTSFFEDQEEELINVKQDLAGTLRSAQRQVLFFSGNLSWANLKQQGKELTKVFEEITEKGVSLKFLANIDITSLANAQKINSINTIIGKERIEIRHCEQPLRAFIVDEKVVKMKETKSSSEQIKKGKNTYLFYEVYDEDWVAWMQKIFWNFFRIGIPLQKRVKDLETIRKL